MHEMSVAGFLITLTVVLVAAKLGAELFERLGQPPVLGELLAGILVGPSLLHVVDPHQPVLHLLSELGAILLLLEVGLESDLGELVRLGPPSLWVATVGVVCPFFLGYLVALALGLNVMTAVFLGATLTATSVGISARVFSDLRRLDTTEAKVVLGAAVADDVLGLIILAVVGGIAQGAALSLAGVAATTAIALGFLVAAVLLGGLLAPHLIGLFQAMQTRGSLGAGAAAFCFALSMLAAKAGLAPIVGAFAAGLVLARTKHRHEVVDALKPVADLLMPVFFVVMGASTLLSSLNPATASGRSTLFLAALLLGVGALGKVVAGLSLPWKGIDRLTVGVGMIPRGEVGLIFAGLGLAHHIIDPRLYAGLLAVVLATTLITPPLLKLVMASRPAVEPAPGPTLEPGRALASNATNLPRR